MHFFSEIIFILFWYLFSFAAPAPEPSIIDDDLFATSAPVSVKKKETKKPIIVVREGFYAK